MFVNEVATLPRIVGGRKFFEQTITSNFRKGEVAITTTYVDGKPLIKEFMLCDDKILRYVWKSKKYNVREEYVQKLNYQA